jgi:hypothetical protein
MNIRILKNLSQHLKIFVMLTLGNSLLFLSTGCSEVDGGAVQNEVQLPTDSTVDFQCADEGIFEEDCVLGNPANPYSKVAVSEANKFELNDSAPSAKARYYLWATALAKGAGIPGENQYYTALSLHELYAESGSPTTQQQAIKAYRSVLDNYFLQATFFVVVVDNENVAFAAPVKDLSATNLYAPTLPTLVSLYTDQIFSLEAMSEWGYIYNVTSGTVAIRE